MVGGRSTTTLKRAKQKPEHGSIKVRCGDLSIDLMGFVTAANYPNLTLIRLYGKEFDVLLILSSNQGIWRRQRGLGSPEVVGFQMRTGDSSLLVDDGRGHQVYWHWLRHACE